MKPLIDTHPSVVEYGMNHIGDGGGFSPGLIADLNWYDFTELIQATTIDKQVLIRHIKQLKFVPETNDRYSHGANKALDALMHNLGLEEQE